jgi:hypothetical protein
MRGKKHLSMSDLPRNFAEFFEKSPARLPDFQKKVHQSYRTFLKLSGNVIRLFENCPARLPVLKKKRSDRVLENFGNLMNGYRTYLVFYGLRR